MWESYKRTFARMQVAIILVSAAVQLGLGHRWLVTAVFFGMMQVGAVAGAWWGERLKRRLQPQH